MSYAARPRPPIVARGLASSHALCGTDFWPSELSVAARDNRVHLDLACVKETKLQQIGVQAAGRSTH